MSHYGTQPWVQRHWDLRAAANFMLGGTGAGLLIAGAIAAPAPRFAIAAGLLLVAAGLGAVWLEIGRKLRALHVFFNPRTSWMTRESFAALGVFVFGAAALTWRAPKVVPLVLTSALAEGAGAVLLFDVVPPALLLAGLALIARAVAWSRFRKALKQQRGADALERPGKMLVLLGTMVPLGLLAATQLDARAALLAAPLIVASGWWLKLALVTRAAFNQGFALPHLPVRGARQEKST